MQWIPARVADHPQAQRELVERRDREPHPNQVGLGQHKLDHEGKRYISYGDSTPTRTLVPAETPTPADPGRPLTRGVNMVVTNGVVPPAMTGDLVAAVRMGREAGRAAAEAFDSAEREVRHKPDGSEVTATD